jgi:hypothetical protein
MARTIAECNTYIVNSLVTNFATVGMTIDPLLWSKRNFLRLICYSFAVAQAYFEQLADQSIAEMEDIQNKSAAATKPWIQDKMFKFQYSATNPQYVQIFNGIPEYPTVDENLKIITACAVTSTVTQTVKVKVAKGDPFVALAAGEITAAQDYIDTIGVAGINYVVTSLDADKLWIVADIWFKGSYNAVIQTNVINALNEFMLNLSRNDFSGYIYVADIMKCIKAVEGVNDATLNDVQCRSDVQAFGAGIDLVIGADVVLRKYPTVAGYIIQEDTAGETFADKLNFIAE